MYFQLSTECEHIVRKGTGRFLILIQAADELMIMTSFIWIIITEMVTNHYIIPSFKDIFQSKYVSTFIRPHAVVITSIWNRSFNYTPLPIHKNNTHQHLIIRITSYFPLDHFPHINLEASPYYLLCFYWVRDLGIQKTIAHPWHARSVVIY